MTWFKGTAEMKTSNSKESPKKKIRRKKTLSKLRSKLHYIEEKLLEKTKDIVNQEKTEKT